MRFREPSAGVVYDATSGAAVEQLNPVFRSISSSLVQILKSVKDLVVGKEPGE